MVLFVFPLIQVMRLVLGKTTLTLVYPAVSSIFKVLNDYVYGRYADVFS